MSYYGPTRNDSKSISGWILLGFLLLLLLSVLTFVVLWATKPLDVMSPDNIEHLSQQANDQWEALQAQKANIVNATKGAQDMVTVYGADQSTWPQGKAAEYLQLLQQARNATTAYNDSCARYNSLWKDEWRSIPAPDDLPTSCNLYSN